MLDLGRNLERPYGISDAPSSKKALSKYTETADAVFNRRRLKSLHSIYDWYSKQQLALGQKPTFEQMQYQMTVLSIGEFLKLCTDFDILGMFIQQGIIEKELPVRRNVDRWRRWKPAGQEGGEWHR